MKVLPYMDFCPDAVGLQHLVGLVGQKGYAQAVLLLELVLGLDRIGGHPQNVHPGFLIFGPKLREINGFAGTAGGIGLGIEVKHELAAVEVGRERVPPPSRGNLNAGAFAPSASSVGMRLPFVPISGSMKL
jgi:hypothetical protein